MVQRALPSAAQGRFVSLEESLTWMGFHWWFHWQPTFPKIQRHSRTLTAQHSGQGHLPHWIFCFSTKICWLHPNSHIPDLSPSAKHCLAHHQGDFANQKVTALILSVLEISRAALGMSSVSPCAGSGSSLLTMIITMRQNVLRPAAEQKLKVFRNADYLLSTKSLLQKASDKKIKAHVEVPTDLSNSRRSFQVPQQIFPLDSGSRAESISCAFGKSLLANHPPKGWQGQSSAAVRKPATFSCFLAHGEVQWICKMFSEAQQESQSQGILSKRLRNYFFFIFLFSEESSPSAKCVFQVFSSILYYLIALS